MVLSWSAASPMVGKVVVMIPSSVHASLLRKNLFESLVTYTICLVSRVFPDLEGPVSRKMTEPRILILWLLAAYTARNITDLLQAVGFTELAQAVNRLHQPGKFVKPRQT